MQPTTVVFARSLHQLLVHRTTVKSQPRLGPPLDKRMVSNIIPILAVCLLCATVQAADYRFSERHSTPGNDINCGQQDDKGNPQTFCKLCGLDELAASCDFNSECKGFNMDTEGCGYLKSAAGEGKAMGAKDSGHFCKIDGSSTCTGNYIMKRRAAIYKQDINCNSTDYVGVNGTLVKVPYCIVHTYTKPYINKAFPYEAAAACDANPDCKAFSRSTSESGGTGKDALLKTAAGPTTYQEGAVTFIKA